jgi:hypothetical protein
MKCVFEKGLVSGNGLVSTYGEASLAAIKWKKLVLIGLFLYLESYLCVVEKNEE